MNRNKQDQEHRIPVIDSDGHVAFQTRETLQRLCGMAFLRFCTANMEYIAALGVAGVFGAKLVSQTLLLERHKKFYQAYKDGFPLPVDQHTHELTEEILNQIQFPAHIEADISTFTCYTQDPIYKGGTMYKTGSIVGLPINFSYNSVEEIQRTKMQAGLNLIDWGLPSSKKFAESLILSDNAKRFAIARQMFYIDSLHVYIDAGLLSLFMLLAYTGGYMSNKLLNLKARAPISVRWTMYAGYFSLCMLLYVMSKDVYFCWQDRKADRRAANLGLELAAGGVEYYTRSLERNKALRELLSDKGPDFYTVYGNEVNSWRLPHEPLTARRDRLMKMVEQLK